MITATTHMDNKTSLQASHCEDEGRSKRKQSHPLVPALRFSEFDGDWDKKKIREVLTIGSGKDYKHLKPGNIPVYGTGGLMAKVDTPIHNGKTVFIGRKGSIDKPFYYDGDFWTVDTLFYTHSFQETEPYFVYGLFQKINWYKHNEASGVPSLSKTTIGSLVVNLPSLPEQQKIASFLSAVDEKIQQLSKKKALLEEYKKGVMQQLFSGQLRFKDQNGNPYPNWEEKQLIDITKINQGLQIAISERFLEPVEDGYFYITNEFLRAKSKKVFYIKSPPASVICDADDILMTRTGNTGQVVTGVNGAFHNNFFKIKYQDHCEKWFLYYFLTSPLTQHTILKLAGTSTIPDLNHGDFYKIKIDLPSIKEQSKISSVVKSIDTKIEAVNNQITQTQTFKKGLLQQMFV
jgi:type I restriction enzyme S subunit